MPEKREIIAALLREHPDGWTADSLLNALHQERLEIVPRYGHALDELRDEFWRVALAVGAEPGDHGGTIDDIDVLSVVTDQVRWVVQEHERLNAATGAVLAPGERVLAHAGLVALLEFHGAARLAFPAITPLAHADAIRDLADRLK